MADSSSGPSYEKQALGDITRDTWDEEDSWTRDDWKNADWGKPAAPRLNTARGRQPGGIASYGKGMMDAGPYLSLGMQIAFGMVLFVGIGYGVDQWLNSTPWGMIVGACVGMIGVFYLVVRMAREADADQKEKQ